MKTFISYLYEVNFCCRINLAGICLLSDDQNKTCLFQFSSRNTPRSLLGTRWRPGGYSWRRAYWRIWYSPVIPFGRFNVSCGLDCWWFYPVLYFLSKEKGSVWRKTSCRTHYGWFLKRFNEGKWEVCLKLWEEGLMIWTGKKKKKGLEMNKCEVNWLLAREKNEGSTQFYPWHMWISPKFKNALNESEVCFRRVRKLFYSVFKRVFNSRHYNTLHCLLWGSRPWFWWPFGQSM